MAKADIIKEALDELYPNAKCELNFKNHFELLCAVALSAQTTDKKVNMVTEKLFKTYPEVSDLANADLDDLIEILKPLGLYRNKANNLIAMSKSLIELYGGEVPSKHDYLIKLNGVGNKTANVVLNVGFDIPAMAVDTHVERVAKRLGLAQKNDSVITVENKLCKVFKKADWNKLHHQFIFFGRYTCKAIKPQCDKCPLITICKVHKNQSR